MLVLSRKTGQRVMIGEVIEVTVLEVRGHRVRLGFRCPDDVRIYREEVVDRATTKPADAAVEPLLSHT